MTELSELMANCSEDTRKLNFPRVENQQGKEQSGKAVSLYPEKRLAHSKGQKPHNHPHQDLIEQIIQLAHLQGWHGYYFRPARVKRGNREIYETPVGGDGRGVPDMVLVRPPRVIVAEVKIPPDTLTPEQKAWIAIWNECPGVEVFVWTPDSWDEIKRELS